MRHELLSPPQTLALLEKLPAESVFEAVRDVEPVIFVGLARMVLNILEEDGIVAWKREQPQCISLTPKGEEMLEWLRNKPK